MANGTFRVDHVEMIRLVGVITQHASTVDDVIKVLTGPYETLRNGDWIGVGADKFYQEMDNAIFPGLQTLAQALNDIAHHSGSAAKLTSEAEQSIVSMSKRA
jgi:WXG100 family type VII secretion target